MANEEQNPALAPEAVSSTDVEKTYKVVGTQAVFGTQPGDTFTAALDKQQEASFLEYGQLEVVSESAPTTTTEEEGDSQASTDTEPQTQTKTRSQAR